MCCVTCLKYLAIICIFRLKNILPPVQSYNLDVSSVVVKKGPTGSYFGFSVAGHIIINTSTLVQTHVILVGAPLADSTEITLVPFRKPGVLYACFLSSSRVRDNCTQLPLHEEYTEADRNYDDQWLGISVNSQGTSDGMAMVCAHKYEKTGKSFRWGIGWCLLLTNDLKADKFLEPCHGKPSKGAHLDYGMCQAGVGAYIDKKGRVLIGAPGPYRGRGVAFGYAISNNSTNFHMWYQSPLEDKPNAEDKIPITDHYSYLGISVTISETLLGGQTTYISGAPRSSNAGEVFLMHADGNGLFYVAVRLSGPHAGSNFGYKVSAVDLDGDGFDDLLVGAPTFFDSTGCGGAVYVYYSRHLTDKSTTPSTIITNVYCKIPDSSFSSNSANPRSSKCEGECHNAWFGLEIESLGDIDQDGFNDVAIGAPYECDGAIYIFLGSRLGISESPSQKISATSVVKSPVRSFGHSMSSSGLDIDSNGFPDLVVGCYASDSVVVLRSRPIIDVYTNITSFPEVIDPNNSNCRRQNSQSECFGLTVCLDYSVRLPAYSKESSELELEFSLEVQNVGRENYRQAHFRSKLYSRILKSVDAVRALSSNDESVDNTTTKNDNFAIRSTPNISMQYRREMTMQPFKKRVRLNSQQTSPHCSFVPVYITESNRDFQTAIPFRLTYKMVSFTNLSPPYSYSPLPSSLVYLNPVLSQDSRSPSERGVKHEVQFLKDCGSDNRCESNLKVWGLMELPKDVHGTYLLKANSVNDLKLFVQVGNLLEDAYATRLFIQLPHTVSFKGSDRQHNCRPLNEVVACELGNPLQRSEEVSLVLRLDASKIDLTTDSFDIGLSVNTTSVEVDLDDNADVIDVKVIFEVDLLVMSYSQPKEIFYDRERISHPMESIENNELEIIHKHEIKNIGQNAAPRVFVETQWPVGGEGSRKEGSYSRPDAFLSVANVTIEGEGVCSITNTTFHPFVASHSSVSRRTKRSSDVLRYLNAFFENYISEPDSTRSIHTLECDGSPASKCLLIKCSIRQLGAGESQVISIRSSVHGKAIFQIYPDVDKLQIKSVSRVKVFAGKNVQLMNAENYVDQAVTSLFLDVSEKRRYKIPEWVIIISTCFGVFCLMIVVSVLCRCGFFKRKRFKEKLFIFQLYEPKQSVRNPVISNYQTSLDRDSTSLH